MTFGVGGASLVAMFSTSSVLPAPFRRVAEASRSAARRILDLALPPFCAACCEPAGGRGLCPSCWSKLSFITRPYCERLGIHFVYDPGPGILSMEAIADPPAYQRARAAVRFDEISRALVHALKYGDRAVALAPAVGAAVQSIGDIGGGSCASNRRAGRGRRAQTGQADGPASRALARRARGQYPGRCAAPRRRR